MTESDLERRVLAAVERRRRVKPKLRDDVINLAHGAGGKATHALVEAVFREELRNPDGDAAVIEGGLAVTTDAYVVKPLFFPGGDIGELAVNGTVNDLAMAGATPLALTAGFILEEGYAVADLRRIAASMARAARAANVTVVAGDTKVVERGTGDGVYITTAGVGLVERDVVLGASRIEVGDQILVSGTMGDHGIAVLVARGGLDLETDLESDTAPLNGIVSALLDAAPGVRWLRDPTRGGVATALNEAALEAELGIRLREEALPVRPAVTGACEILGLDPLYVANEGKLIAIVAPDSTEAALAALRAHELGRDAAVIGGVVGDSPGLVVLDTAFGGARIVDMLAGDPLPRIC